MMSTSDVGMGLNMEEFSFMSKRVPKKRNERGIGVSLMCQPGSSLCPDFYSSGPGQWPGSQTPALDCTRTLWKCSPFFFLLLHTFASCITNISWSLFCSRSWRSLILPAGYESSCDNHSHHRVITFLQRYMKSCVTRTVYCRRGGGCLLSALLLGLRCHQSKRLQDGLLVSLFQVHEFI